LVDNKELEKAETSLKKHCRDNFISKEKFEKYKNEMHSKALEEN
jgi:hypothetical protein